MIDLNNLEEIKNLDPKNTFGSTEMLADQCEQMWNDGRRFELPVDYKDTKNIIICGMGGSSYGGHIIKALFAKDMKVPVDIINDYHLPTYANENSLVILTSYSGTTEEVLSCAGDAKKLSCKIVVLSAGGDLAKIQPALIFDPKFNPSNQPRLAPGYIVIGTLVILSKLGFVKISEVEWNNALSQMRNSIEQTKESAQELAKKIHGTIPVIFAGTMFEGNAHIIRNQFNETAKSFSAYSPISELNHHLMEGLKNPPDKKLTILFLDSKLYPEIINKRVKLTKEVVLKNNVNYCSYQALGENVLSQMLNLLTFGGYLTIYTALLYGLDPSLIPWVDYFKDQLKK